MTLIHGKQIEHHHCHAPACPRWIPPERLMCKHHWSMVPAEIRARVNREFRPEQCERSRPRERPSLAWLQAARDAIRAVEEARR